eukprot:XP_011670906.1 PREDICTED: uncharacterized protein LOC105441482 [Strongylocentrotus purpuratus]
MARHVSYILQGRHAWPGLGTIKDHCVSCRDHPRADGCQTEDVNTTPAPHGGEDGNSNQDDGNPDQDDSNPNQDLKESKNGQERGLSTAGLVLICLFCGIVIGIVICLAILALGGASGFDNSFALATGQPVAPSNSSPRLGSGLAPISARAPAGFEPDPVTPYSGHTILGFRCIVRILKCVCCGVKIVTMSMGANIRATEQLTAETTTPHDTTTPASARDRESDAPVHGNGEATLANGPSSSINANNISTSGEQPSSNSPPVDDQPTRSQEDAPTPASANNRETDAPVHQNTEATLQNGSSNSINANGISTSEEGLSSYSHPVDVQPKRSQEDALTPASASDRETDELLTGNGAATLQNGPSNSMNSNQETFMLDSVPSYSTQVANLTTEETTGNLT